jgi:hypothetical protein
MTAGSNFMIPEVSTPTAAILNQMDGLSHLNTSNMIKQVSVEDVQIHQND